VSESIAQNKLISKIDDNWWIDCWELKITKIRNEMNQKFLNWKIRKRNHMATP
jgi:hypothetical protein